MTFTAIAASAVVVLQRASREDGLTNLLLADAFDIPFARFARIMIVPQLVGGAATYGLLKWRFRAELPTSFDVGSLPEPSSAVADLGFDDAPRLETRALTGYDRRRRAPLRAFRAREARALRDTGRERTRREVASSASRPRRQRKLLTASSRARQVGSAPAALLGEGAEIDGCYARAHALLASVLGLSRCPRVDRPCVRCLRSCG